MKTKSLIIILIVISSFSVKSQTPEKISGFSDIKLSYNISFIKDKPDFIPFGTGLEFTYNISKKFSGDFGITFKPTGKKIEDIYYPGDWGPGVLFHNELNDTYLDFPIHMNYQLLNTKTFKILISSGTRGTYFNIKHSGFTAYDNQEPIYYNSKGTNFSLGLDFGLIESIMITEKIGVFASQFYGNYLTGTYRGFESTDIKIGLTYNLK